MIHWKVPESNKYYTWLSEPVQPTSYTCNAEGVLSIYPPHGKNGVEITMDLRDAYKFTFHVASEQDADGYGRSLFKMFIHSIFLKLYCI